MAEAGGRDLSGANGDGVSGDRNFPRAALEINGTKRTIPEPATFRMVMVSFLAAAIGLLAGAVAFALYKLIGLFTNLAFYHRWAADFTSARFNTLGPWVIVVPVIGGIIVGFMAKYGSDKIKGHGIPEAMEAVLINRSRIQPRVAILKPISAAIAIGTGGPFGAEGPIIQTGGAVGSLVIDTEALDRLHLFGRQRFEQILPGVGMYDGRVRDGKLAAVELAPLRLGEGHGRVLLMCRTFVVTNLAVVPVQGFAVLGGNRDG